MTKKPSFEMNLDERLRAVAPSKHLHFIVILIEFKCLTWAEVFIFIV